MKNPLKILLIAAAILSLTTVPAHASMIFGFSCISNNDPGDCAIGEAQLTVDVSESGSLVLFTFLNSGPLASSITDVYFDDGSLLSIAGFIDADENGGDAGVDFSQGASPPNLPAGNNASPPFVTTAGLLADSDPPVQPNGVNPGESLGVLFNLQSGQTFASVINDINSGDLRIGIHVQGFATGGSESFVNTIPPPVGPAPIPEPGTLLLIGSGLVGLGAGAWRRRKF